MISDELANVERMLASPQHRPFLLRGAVVAKLAGLTPTAVSNLARRSHTGVTRYPGGYDYWEIHRWKLRRNQAQASRAERRRVREPAA